MTFAEGLARLAAMALATAVLLPAGECGHSPGFYEREGYAVRNVVLRGPLRHFRFVREETLRAGLPLRLREVNGDGSIKEAGTFRTVPWSLGTTAIQNRLRDPALLQRFEILFVTASLESCDAAAKSLDAVYNILAFSIPAGLAFDSQSAGQMVARSLLGPGLSRLLSGTFAQPMIGYNASRGLFGGVAVHQQVAAGGPLDQLAFVVTGSGSSLQAEVELEGARSRNRGALRDRDWGLNYRYSDVRSATGPALRERLVTGRFGAFTKPLGGLAAGLRIGLAAQGGSGQTDAANFSDSFRSASSATAKFYAGTTLAGGPYVGRLSYAVQRTHTGGGLGGSGFFKNVLDTRHEFRLMLRDHRPLTVEVDAGAGWMPNNRVLPVHEAFYGGNAVRPYIAGDPWEVRADPLFRGSPQLSAGDRAGSFGATRFGSLNTTAAFTVWGRPLVPQEVLSDAAFTAAFKAQLTTAESALSGDYITGDARFPAMGKAVADVKPEIASIEKRLREIQDKLPEASRKQADDALSALEDVSAAVDSAISPEQGSSPTLAYRTLALGFDEESPATLKSLSDSLRGISKRDLASDDASWLEVNAQRLDALRGSVATELTAIEARAEAKARVELAFARRVMDSLLYRINIVSVSPLAMFDIVRLGYRPDSPTVSRSGAGLGVRLSLVNVNLSMGYMFNLRGPADAERGAFLVSFSVSGLFR